MCTKKRLRFFRGFRGPKYNLISLLWYISFAFDRIGRVPCGWSRDHRNLGFHAEFHQLHEAPFSFPASCATWLDWIGEEWSPVEFDEIEYLNHAFWLFWFFKCMFWTFLDAHAIYIHLLSVKTDWSCLGSFSAGTPAFQKLHCLLRARSNDKCSFPCQNEAPRRGHGDLKSWLQWLPSSQGIFENMNENTGKNHETS